jgi:raffinose/stachyose/melibiose transport system permease protein
MARVLSDALHTRVNRVEVRRQHSRGPGPWFVLGLATLLAVTITAPLGLMLLNAFKDSAEYSATGALSVPSHLDFTTLAEYVKRVDFGRKLLNSIVLSTGVGAGTVLISTGAAYAIGIGRVRGRVLILTLFLLAIILPHEALIYPLFTGVQLLNLSN